LIRVRGIDVEKSSSHHLSQNEIAGDNPCSQHLIDRDPDGLCVHFFLMGGDGCCAVLV
jgi:hypothetical protein